MFCLVACVSCVYIVMAPLQFGLLCIIICHYSDIALVNDVSRPQRVDVAISNDGVTGTKALNCINQNILLSNTFKCT